jgi:N utilization substance protein A
MSSSIAQNIEALCQEQGIDRDLVIEAMKEAVRAAPRNSFDPVKTSRSTGMPKPASSYRLRRSSLTKSRTPPPNSLSSKHASSPATKSSWATRFCCRCRWKSSGRIAAQTAKQILFQKVRDAVRSNVYEQYIDKIGDLVNGYVKRFERGNIIVDLGNLEAILPRSQQSRGEQWNQGERIRVVINNVSKESKGPQVEVSRTSPELLLRLFEMEVPEIYDGTVVIKSAVREPGERAKIAVMSNERDVDPVGACVGMKGSRVQAIIRELRGEKIDIIEWSDEPSVFAPTRCHPRKSIRSESPTSKTARWKSSSTKINSRWRSVSAVKTFASRRSSWAGTSTSAAKKRSSAKSPSRWARSSLPARQCRSRLSKGVTPQQAEALAAHDINDIDALAPTTVDDLVEFPRPEFGRSGSDLEGCHGQ